MRYDFSTTAVRQLCIISKKKCYLKKSTFLQKKNHILFPMVIFQITCDYRLSLGLASKYEKKKE